MAKIIVDFNKTLGKIKPLHGIGQPPMVSTHRAMDTSAFRFLKEAGIPYSRLHDVGGAYGGNRFVDVPNIFRDFSKDPYDEKSYHFAFTDILIKSLMENNCEPYFRLGVTIENQCNIEPFNIMPPEDNHKWAVVCEHIIKHYTEGWANGFNYDIKYWEIWNEPDNNEYEFVELNPLWRGSKEQYFELYKVASKHLKEKFPHLKIGGYGSCGFYGIMPECEANMNPAAFGRYSYFIEFYEDFIKFCKENDCPLDFSSWHTYNASLYLEEYARYSRRILDEAGFTETEMHVNEWDAGANFLGTGKQAAIVTEVLIRMQKTCIDVSTIYDGKFGLGRYALLFGHDTKNDAKELGNRVDPLPTYYAFLSFNELYKRQNEVFASTDDSELTVLAAKGEDGAILIANPTDKVIDLEFDCNLPLGDFFATDDSLKMSYCLLKDKILPKTVLLIRTK